MRTLQTLTVVGILIFAAGSATAEGFRQDSDQMAMYQTRDPLGPGHGPTTLKLSPMFLEIYRINNAAIATEQELLSRLALTQDEKEVESFVYRLERLDIERQLSVLKVRVKYAKLEGRYDLAFRLREGIVQLLERDAGPLM